MLDSVGFRVCGLSKEQNWGPISFLCSGYGGDSSPGVKRPEILDIPPLPQYVFIA